MILNHSRKASTLGRGAVLIRVVIQTGSVWAWTVVLTDRVWQQARRSVLVPVVTLVMDQRLEAAVLGLAVLGCAGRAVVVAVVAHVAVPERSHNPKVCHLCPRG